jgi:hypothetical protein
MYLHLGCADKCVDCARAGNTCQRWRRRDRRERRTLQGKTAPEGPSPLRRVELAAYGTVMVVPSPVAVMENVPALLEVYP